MRKPLLLLLKQLLRQQPPRRLELLFSESLVLSRILFRLLSFFRLARVFRLLSFSFVLVCFLLKYGLQSRHEPLEPLESEPSGNLGGHSQVKNKLFEAGEPHMCIF